MEVFIIKKNDKPYFVGLTNEVKPNEYNALVRECAKVHEQEEQEKKILLERLAKAEQKIEQLEREIKIDRGEI